MSAAPSLSSRTPSLRERKKRRTRESLVSAAFALFGQRGYVETTLDDLCAAAEVSKRTFFRYFRGKEDVVLEPGHEMWADLVDELTVRDVHDDPVLSVLGGAVVHVVGERIEAGGDWLQQIRASRVLAAANPGIDAAGLWWCDRVCDQLAEILQRRGGGPLDDPRPRMCVDLVVYTTNDVLRNWAAEPTASDGGDLVAALDRRFRILPELAGFTVVTASGSGRRST